MAYNGDTGMAKRLKTENDVNNVRDFDNYKSYDTLRRKKPEAEPNHVLLFTIINPLYPITVDVLHTICSPQANVLRIVIFKKNGVQAMIEFESVEAARTVKDALNGADIYSGCCTLKIEFAKPSQLNVYKNDMDSWDYTVPQGGEKMSDQPPPRQAPLLQDPRFGAGPAPYRGGGGGSGGGGGGGGPFLDYEEGGYQNGPNAYGDHYMGPERYPPPPPDSGNFSERGRHRTPLLVASSDDGPKGRDEPVAGRLPREVRYGMKGGMGREGMMGGSGRGGGGGPPPQFGAQPTMGSPNGPGPIGCVMMAYGLDPTKANPDKLFNLFCLYGNVIRIKFLKTKEGCAMIQMGDGVSVDRCIHHLKNAPLFGSTLQLGFSKQAFLSEVAQPYTLPDNSPSFKDFSSNKNNRFLNPAMASKNRIQGPAKILHFFNTPPDVTEEQLFNAIAEKEVKLPTVIKLFPKKDRSSSGLMEFDEIADAINALVHCNHLPIKYPDSKFPYVMKLCFSSTRSISNMNGSAKEDQ